jgi:hypothetical protein
MPSNANCPSFCREREKSNLSCVEEGGTLTDMALPAALGFLAEAVVFFLPALALTLPIGRQVLAWAFFPFISLFALTNSLRMASIIAADQAVARPAPNRRRQDGRPCA